MQTHGHGQGYTDINFVIPELLDRIEYKKGTYYADEGNFSAAGAVDLHYVDLDRRRRCRSRAARTITCAAARPDRRHREGDLLFALDYGGTNGPWELPENLRRVNALVRYARGTECGAGYAITASAYDGEWESTDQVPERAVEAGALDRFGYVDPTNGGESHRYALAKVRQFPASGRSTTAPARSIISSTCSRISPTRWTR